MRLEFFPYPFLIGVGILLILLIVLWRRKRSLSYLLCFSIFWMYLVIFIGLTIFPIPIRSNFEKSVWRESIAHVFSRINLVPFCFGDLFSLHPNIILQEIVGNILLTVPFGFGIIFITPVKSKNIIWLAFLVGLVIETFQLLISIGLGGSYRSTDINDVILNALGVFIGYGLFRMFAWIFLKIKHRYGINPKELFAFIDDIINQVSVHDHNMHKLN
jgi:glycopeptide antibiotics resistance protein